MSSVMDPSSVPPQGHSPEVGYRDPEESYYRLIFPERVGVSMCFLTVLSRTNVGSQAYHLPLFSFVCYFSNWCRRKYG